MTNKALKELYVNHTGKSSDKWSNYLIEYNLLFSQHKNQEINILEIGIQNGGSLEIWAEFFGNAKRIIGCDINPRCELLQYEDPRIAVIVGDANQDLVERAILNKASSFDIIIDDGSHTSTDIIRSFARYFKHIPVGGLYVAEDLHCSYWKEFGGGLYDPLSSLSFFKRLIDIVHSEHWGINTSRLEALETFQKKYDVAFSVEDLAQIHSIEFLNSICVIRKRSPEFNVSGLRQIVGNIELVEKGVKQHHNSVGVPTPQANNFWSNFGQPFEQELIDNLAQLKDLKIQAEAAIRLAKSQEQEVRKLRIDLQKSVDNTQSLELKLADNLITCDQLNSDLSVSGALVSSAQKQIDLINFEIIQLLAERATFGAQVGRTLTKTRSKIAPVGSRRGALVSLAAKASRSIANLGLKTTLSRFFDRTFLKAKSDTSTNLASLDNLNAPRQIGTKNTFSGFPEGVSDLGHWFMKNEPSADDLIEQRVVAAAFTHRPLISIIIPIYKLPPNVLEETLKCLEAQTYSDWQACLVWSDLEDLISWQWLQERCSKDSRFKCKLLKENGGISRNSNAAFELATGEYIALLDHDDTLAPWALYEVAKLLQSKPELDFIYSDKDSISADGSNRLNALFKPGWSPEILHSVNYLTHLNVIRTRVITEIGGWRPETDGAQDWDLFFRITEKTNAIAHIPSVLYHWRILPTSTATGLAAKPYAAMGQLKAQQDSFIRRKIPAAVLPSADGMFKVVWPVNENMSHVVIFQTGTLADLHSAVEALSEAKQSSIYCLDILCTEPPNIALVNLKSKFKKEVTFTTLEVVNWKVALDFAASKSRSETIVLLDGKAIGYSDTLIEELSGWAYQHPEIAWASAVILQSDGSTVYEAGRVVGLAGESAPLFNGAGLYSYGWLGGPLWYRNTSACSPLAVAISTTHVRELQKSPIPLSDSLDGFTQFCLALTANGKRGVINPFARVKFKLPLETGWPNDGAKYHQDPFFNIAFDSVSPLRLKR
jgi:Glycosyl transferase family 2